MTWQECLKPEIVFCETRQILNYEITELKGNAVIIKASILDQAGAVLATGHAMEISGSSHINKGSHIENCETSAWGRALANFGIGIDVSVASATGAAVTAV